MILINSNDFIRDIKNRSKFIINIMIYIRIYQKIGDIKEKRGWEKVREKRERDDFFILSHWSLKYQIKEREEMQINILIYSYIIILIIIYSYIKIFILPLFPLLYSLHPIEVSWLKKSSLSFFLSHLLSPSLFFNIFYLLIDS